MTGFKLTVAVINPLKTSQINNIAQLFGNSPANPSDPQDTTPNPLLPVVDESGDNQPNNFNADGTPGAKDALIPGIVDNTVAESDSRNPTTMLQDLKGDNTGNSPNGEFLLISVVPDIGVFNGPKDSPTAIGQAPSASNSDNNHDFINKSSDLLPGVRSGEKLKLDSPAVGFFNTVQNTSTLSVDIKVFPSKFDELFPDGTKVTLP